MTTWSAGTTLAGADQAHRLDSALERLNPPPLGTSLLMLEDGLSRFEVTAWFNMPPDEIALALLAAAFGARPFTISFLPETDWVTRVQRELHPVRAGRFIIHGRHDAGSIPSDCIALQIDAATAFGTGHHGSTRGCLLALDPLANGGWQFQRIIDVGCGTGVLAMAAARLWPPVQQESGCDQPPSGIVASDCDPLAVEVARNNVSVNGLKGAIDCVVADGVAHPAITALVPVDLVLANILSEPLIELAPALRRCVVNGGVVVLSGILAGQESKVLTAYGLDGFVLKAQRTLDDWAVLVLRRDDGENSAPG